TNGFLFGEKKAPRTLDIGMAKRYGIGTEQFTAIKNGANGISDKGETVANHRLTLDPPKPKRYAFCSDTAYHEAMVPIIQGADALYHESTFLEPEAHLCARTKHSTAKEAGQIAALAGVGQLILGHYSTRYNSLAPFQEEAR